MGLATAGGPRLTADQFRARSGVSCVPGAHSQSGGLFISDVVRVFAELGEEIDYGPVEGGYTRWAPPMLAAKLGTVFGAVLLGDYDALPSRYRASATFLGDHSTWAHDYRASDGTVCWHDPLRRAPIRIPISAALAYWQKAGSPVRGLAGWVRIAIAPPDTSTEEDMATVTIDRYPEPRGASGTNITGYLADGTTLTEATWSGLVSGTAVVERTDNRAPQGSGWVVGASRPFTGYLLPAAALTIAPAPPTPDPKAAVNAALDRVAAALQEARP